MCKLWQNQLFLFFFNVFMLQKLSFLNFDNCQKKANFTCLVWQRVKKSEKISKKKTFFLSKFCTKTHFFVQFFYLKSSLGAGKKCGFVTKLSHILFMSKKMWICEKKSIFYLFCMNLACKNYLFWFFREKGRNC